MNFYISIFFLIFLILIRFVSANDYDHGLDEVEKLRAVSFIIDLQNKFGNELGKFIFYYTFEFFKKTLNWNALYFILNRDSARLYKLVSTNWQAKRFLVDFSYILEVSGLPRLTHLDKSIKPTKVIKNKTHLIPKSTANIKREIIRYDIKERKEKIIQIIAEIKEIKDSMDLGTYKMMEREEKRNNKNSKNNKNKGKNSNDTIGTSGNTEKEKIVYDSKEQEEVNKFSKLKLKKEEMNAKNKELEIMIEHSKICNLAKEIEQDKQNQSRSQTLSFSMDSCMEHDRSWGGRRSKNRNKNGDKDGDIDNCWSGERMKCPKKLQCLVKLEESTNDLYKGERSKLKECSYKDVLGLKMDLIRKDPFESLKMVNEIRSKIIIKTEIEEFKNKVKENLEILQSKSDILNEKVEEWKEVFNYRKKHKSAKSGLFYNKSIFDVKSKINEVSLKLKNKFELLKSIDDKELKEINDDNGVDLNYEVKINFVKLINDISRSEDNCSLTSESANNGIDIGVTREIGILNTISGSENQGRIKEDYSKVLEQQPTEEYKIISKKSRSRYSKKKLNDREKEEGSIRKIEQKKGIGRSKIFSRLNYIFIGKETKVPMKMKKKYDKYFIKKKDVPVINFDLKMELIDINEVLNDFEVIKNLKSIYVMKKWVRKERVPYKLNKREIRDMKKREKEFEKLKKRIGIKEAIKFFLVSGKKREKRDNDGNSGDDFSQKRLKLTSK